MITSRNQVDPRLVVDAWQRGNAVALHADVPGRRHLEPRGQVHPELEQLQRPTLALERRRGDLGMDETAAGRHPLDAALVDDALMARGVLVREFAFEDEGDRLETAMRVRPEGQSVIVGRIDLWPVMIEKQKRAEMTEARPGKRATGLKVGDVIAKRGVQALDGSLLGHDGGPWKSAYGTAHMRASALGRYPPHVQRSVSISERRRLHRWKCCRTWPWCRIAHRAEIRFPLFGTMPYRCRMPATPAWPPQSTPRLFVETSLGEDMTLRIGGSQAHYLLSVMRMKPGDPVKLFDGSSGEWLASRRRSASATCCST